MSKTTSLESNDDDNNAANDEDKESIKYTSYSINSKGEVTSKFSNETESGVKKVIDTYWNEEAGDDDDKQARTHRDTDAIDDDNQEHNNNETGITKPNKKYIGITHDRDPYDTDTDQSIDGNSDDIDENGNILRGLRELTLEEFEEYSMNMGESKTHNDDDEEKEEGDQSVIFGPPLPPDMLELRRLNDEDTDDEGEETKEIKAIYMNEEVNALESEDGWEIWLGDTGASCHVTNNSEFLSNSTECKNDKVIVGDKRKCETTSKGDLGLLINDDDDRILLKEIRIVPDIGKNIVGIGSILK